MHTLLKQSGPLHVIGEAVDAEQISERLRASCPDLLLLDWEICKKHTSGLLAEWKKLCPGVQILALSGNEGARAQALEAGAAAFVSMAEPPERLLEAIREIQSGSERRA